MYTYVWFSHITIVRCRPTYPTLHRSMTQKLHVCTSVSADDSSNLTAPIPTCNHIGVNISHPVVSTAAVPTVHMNGPTQLRDSVSPGDNHRLRDDSPPQPPHKQMLYKMNLRSGDLSSPSSQYSLQIDESQLVRRKIRRRFSDGDMGNNSVDGGRNSGSLVLKDVGGPALNLRHRPYTVAKPNSKS